MKYQKPITTPLTIIHIDYSPSDDVIMMYCKTDHNDKTHFQAGQFMLLTITINDQIIKRPYSIATTPQLLSQQGLIGFSIKRVKDGVFSTWATRVAQAGDTLTMTGALGRMVDDESCDDYLLISAGSGLSPIYSIYHDLLHSSRLVRIANIFGERVFDHILPDVHRDRVTHSGQDEVVDPCNIYSQCFLSQDEYEGYTLGRVQLGLANALDRLATTQIQVFICGAPAMVDEVRNHLIAEYGIDHTCIHFEKY